MLNNSSPGSSLLCLSSCFSLLDYSSPFSRFFSPNWKTSALVIIHPYGFTLRCLLRFFVDFSSTWIWSSFWRHSSLNLRGFLDTLWLDFGDDVLIRTNDDAPGNTRTSATDDVDLLLTQITLWGSLTRIKYETNVPFPPVLLAYFPFSLSIVCNVFPFNVFMKMSSIFSAVNFFHPSCTHLFDNTVHLFNNIALNLYFG